MKQSLKIWIGWAVMLLALLSCSDESLIEPGDTGEGSGINIGTRSILFPNSPDDKVSGLRIIAFDTRWHLVQNNRYYTASELSSNILYRINNGTYDFVVIANEPRGGEVNTALDQVSSLSDLDNIQLPASAFNDQSDIPMLYTTNNVEVLTGNRGVRVDGVTHQIWEIMLKRLGTRFDLVLYSNSGTASDLTGLAFNNLPDFVPLMGGNYTGAQTGNRVYTVAANSSYFQPTTVSGAAWAMKVNRIILPSNTFFPESQTSRSAVLKMQLANGVLNPQCLLAMNEAGNDYTLPTNKNFLITAKVEYPVEVNIGVTDWGIVNLNGNIYTKRTLSVSDFTPRVSNLNMARIYFASSESNVNIAATGYVGATGTTPFTVNNVFTNLSGTSAANLHYTSGTSTGYIDINLADPNPASQQTYRIYLEANGLIREITVSTTNRTSVAWGATKFTGTFHRWNQTGERLIYGTDEAGTWTAEVEYPVGQTSFVVLSPLKSLDPSLGTNNPGDAENFKVVNGAALIGGAGALYFRVGLTGTLASASAAPRYARVKVTSSVFGTSYIYVRQGEAADYIMRPQDTGGNGESWGSPNPRPNARKFAAFNLTDPQKGIGEVNCGNQGYRFTDYPTQGGYLFQWYGTGAWSPRLAVTPNWNTQGAPGYWSANPNWETCPPGYHRPNDGSTSEPVDMNNPTIVADSEMRQSLWLNPSVGESRSWDNSVYGYYADGFFERHQITNYTYPNDVVVVNFISSTGVDAAFAGAVTYNPATFASTFFPYPPYYNWNGGVSTGTYGTYQTSSGALQNGISMFMHRATVFLYASVVTYGRSIRCVAD